MALNTYNLHNSYLMSCVHFVLNALLDIKFVNETDVELCKNAFICTIVAKNSSESNMIRKDTISLVTFLNKPSRVNYILSNFRVEDDGYHFLAIDTEIHRFIVKNKLWVDGSRTRCDFNKIRVLLSN